jgi:hypothetical protein
MTAAAVFLALSLYSLLGSLSSPSLSAAVAASLPTTAPAGAPSPQSSSPLSREETPSLETQQQQQLRPRHCLCVRACLPACEEEGLSLDPARTYFNQENSKEGLSLDPPRTYLRCQSASPTEGEEEHRVYL